MPTKLRYTLMKKIFAITAVCALCFCCNAQDKLPLKPIEDPELGTILQYQQQLHFTVGDSVDEQFDLIVPQLAAQIKNNSDKHLRIDFVYNNTAKQALNGQQDKNAVASNHILRRLKEEGVNIRFITLGNLQSTAKKESDISSSISIRLLTYEQTSKLTDLEHKSFEKKKRRDRLRGDNRNRYIQIKKSNDEKS
jgi:hypothetical protein